MSSLTWSGVSKKGTNARLLAGEYTAAHPVDGTKAPAVSTPWLYYPEQYAGTCETEGGASWLQVTPVAASGDTRPLVNEIAGPTWGYHFQDINLTLGNLVADVHAAELAFSS